MTAPEIRQLAEIWIGALAKGVTIPAVEKALEASRHCGELSCLSRCMKAVRKAAEFAQHHKDPKLNVEAVAWGFRAEVLRRRAGK